MSDIKKLCVCCGKPATTRCPTLIGTGRLHGISQGFAPCNKPTCAGCIHGHGHPTRKIPYTHKPGCDLANQFDVAVWEQSFCDCADNLAAKGNQL